MGKTKTPPWKTVARAGIALGVVLLVAGLVVRDIRVRAAVEQDIISLVLVILGGLITLAGIALNWRELVNLVTSREAGEKANFAAVVLLVLALAGLLCYITNRRYSRMDWTGRRKHSLHSQTENFLRKMEQGWNAYVIYSDLRARQPQVYDHVLDTLQEFKARAPQMTIDELNIGMAEPQKRIRQLQQELGIMNLELPSVLLVMGDKHEVIPIGQIVEANPGRMGPPAIAFKGEGAFLGALMKLTEEEKPVLYALTGHGERPLEATGRAPSPAQPMPGERNPGMSLSKLVRSIENANYEVKPLNLATEGEVPQDCAVLLIAGPKTAFSEQEMAALRDYLEGRNGAAIVLADPELAENVDSNLEELLGPYGVQLHTSAVGIALVPTFLGAGLSTSVPVKGSALPPHPVTEGLQGYTLYMEEPCTMEVAPAGPQTMQGATELLTGPPTSWGETDVRLGEEIMPEYKAGEDTPKPAVVGALVAPQPPPQAPPGMEMPGPRIVVLGSSLSFVNAFLERAEYTANRYLLLNCVNWMAGKTQKLGIPPKTMDFNQLSVGKGWVAASRYIFLGAVPGLVIALGVAVWLIRRR